MTIDQLIKALETFKKNGISGETPVIVDSDGYREVAGLEATSRNMDDMPESLFAAGESQFFPTITL